METTTLAALTKFASGKNLKALKADTTGNPVADGSHPVAVTVTLLGRLAKAPNGEQTRTTFPAAAQAFSIALSKVNAATRAAIVQAVREVQEGADFEASPEVTAALDSLTVKKTTPRTGATVFHGRIQVEEKDDIQAQAFSTATGLTVSTVTSPPEED